jgi:hypothetical protein
VAFEKLYVGHCVVLNGKILYCRVAVRINVRLALAKWAIARKRNLLTPGLREAHINTKHPKEE